MADTGLQSPTTTGTVSNEWANPTDAYASDGSSASEITNGQKQDYDGYGFSLSGNNIDGIIVRIDAEAAGTRTISVDLSWDNGSNWTSVKTTPTIAGTITTYNLGGSSDDWGHAFTAGEVANGSFLARVTNNGGATIFLDWIPITVYYSIASVHTTMVAETGTHTLTGNDVILSTGYTMEAETGSYTLTGIAVNFRQAINLITETGAYTLTGISTALTWATKLVAQTGSYLLTGFNVIFRGGGSYEITNQSKSSPISPTNQSQNNISPTGQSKSTTVTFKNREKT